MRTKTLLAAALAATAFGASCADFEINVDLKAPAIKDVRKTDCATTLGFNGGLTEFCNPHWVYQEYPDTEKVLRAAGVYLLGARGQKYWAQCDWVQKKLAEFRASGKKLEDLPKAERRQVEDWMTYPEKKVVWDYWKNHGIKVFVCFDGGKKTFVDGGFVDIGPAAWENQCIDFVKWIVDEKYTDIVAGFRLGNEPYWGGAQFKDHAIEYVDMWTNVLPAIKRLWPKAHVGINLAEYFDNDPDIAAVRSRSLASEPHADNAYFAARTINQWSGQVILRMKELDLLKHIDHIDYHGYGAETPYSGSYHGIKRYRKFMKAFPELDHIKKMWITEWRDRSDEANRSHQTFFSTLWKAHWCLTSLAQPDIDGTSLHCISSLAGGIAMTDGREWNNYWTCYGHVQDRQGVAHMEVGPAGPLFRIFNEALLKYPEIIAHGVNGVTEGEDRFFAGTRYYDSWVKMRKAGEDEPEDLDGSVEWVVLRGWQEVSLLMVNTTSKAKKVRVNFSEPWSAIQPLYQAVSCDTDKILLTTIPGEPPLWRESAWEDTMGPGWFAGGVNGEWRPRRLHPLTIKIAPNTIQSVRIPLDRLPKPKK